jgi:DNA polymerase III delta subunit
MAKNILIIHGDDIAQSRKILNEEKSKITSVEFISLDANKSTYTDIIYANEAISILAEEKIILIENLLTGRKSNEKSKIIDYLRYIKPTNSIIIYENRQIDKKSLTKYFPSAKIISCSYPQVLFKFLDSIGNTDSSRLVQLFHAVLFEKEAELVYVMLIRQFRLLIIAQDLGGKGLSEMAPWQAMKFERQAKYFTLPKLISLYRKLVSIDMKIKTGITPYNVTALLDIFLFSL